MSVILLLDENGEDITNEELYCVEPDCLGEPWCTAWGICSENKAKNLEIHQEEPTTSENIPDNFSEIDQLFKEVKEPQVESISNVFIGNTDVSKSNSELKERFAPAKTTREIELHRRNSMAKKTREDMEYCLRIWIEWRKCRNEQSHMTKAEIEQTLCRFVLEARKKNGYQYPPNTYHHICCGIMHYLRSESHPDIDFFRDASFSRFREVLDVEMKRLQKEGLGSKPRQAEPLSVQDEEHLWTTKLLGGHNGRSLVDTMLFMCGTYFALCSGQEHRALQLTPSQIELVERPGERAFLRYTEDV